MTNRQYILTYAEQTEKFAPDELWSWLKEKTEISRNTVACVLSRMVANGELLRSSKGIYTKSEGKTIFRLEPGETEKRIYKILKEKLPFAPFCIYNGSVFASLQHHLSENTVTYVETDKSALDIVFNILKKSERNVWLQPDSEMVYRYIDLSEGGVIIKPLVTESPITINNEVPQPTLEKLLVDIKKDPDFSYMQGVECERMWENAKTLYCINESRLGRYARRRGLTKKNKI